MSLLAKLSRLTGSPTAGSLFKQAPISLVGAGRSDPPKNQRFLVEPTPTAEGPLQLVDQVFGPGTLQGRVCVTSAREVTASTLAILAQDPTLRAVEAGRMLFLDTETTGLHGGAGTLPFLVGMAWFEGPSLFLRQLFLGQPGEERPVLAAVAERLAAASLLVTFNGKSFDWPLLRTRFVLNRLALPVAPPHLDLLHCARRVFRARLGTTRLVDLEQGVLGFERRGDLPGAEIPAVYFDWLRHGTTDRMSTVLEHNSRDLVSMAGVLAELSRRFEAPSFGDHPSDCLSLAQVAGRAGDWASAEALARCALRAAGDPTLLYQGLLMLGRCASRRGDWAAQARMVERACSLPVSEHLRSRAHLILSRLSEHRFRQPARALLHARLAAAAESLRLHARRVTRLERRLAAARGDPQYAF